MKYDIRRISIAHLSDCAEIIRQSHQTVADDFGFNRESNPSNGAFIRAKKLLDDFRKGIVMFAPYHDGQQVGFAAVEKSSDTLYFLEKLSVLPNYRHKGFGKALIDYARIYVKQNGGKQISISIINENARLKKWYEIYGFVQTEIREYEHLPFAVCFMLLNVDEFD